MLLRYCCYRELYYYDMREAQFLKQNAEKWQQFEDELTSTQNTDLLADRFVELTDDLAYSKTFYPKSNTSKYLNGLAAPLSPENL